jgi:hypothetical protein
MIKTWLADLNNFGIAAVDAFLLPGTIALSQFVAYAPALALRLGVAAETDGAFLPAVLSLLVWLLLAVLVWKFIRLLQDVARNVNAIVRAICSRILNHLHALKTLLVCKIRQMIPVRKSDNRVSIPEVRFDDLDLSILRTGAALPPGLVLSAPDIAGQLTVRPAQAQRSLDKLRKYELVDSVIGATDGFDNYRLTRSGVALLSVWHRGVSVS